MNPRLITLLSMLVIISLATSSCKNKEEKVSQAPAADSTALADVYQKLIDSATKVRNNAYAPYSKFLAGAAV